METNINESLGIDVPVATVQEETNEYSAEKTLTAIANIVLIIGIIGALIMAFTITQTTIGPMGIVLTIVTLMSSVTVWALLRVICNISTSLKEINSKTNKLWTSKIQ